LLLSIFAGLASGVLIGAIGFEMIPQALERAGLLATCVAIGFGVAVVYAFDLYVNRGAMAGPQADQHRKVLAFHRRHKPRGSEVTVLAGATSAEELIEGVVIGVSAAISGGMGLVVGLAIAFDNISEALTIGTMIREGRDTTPGKTAEGKAGNWKVLGWTGLIGLSLAVSALAGWFLLRGLPPFWLGALSGLGAGAILYLTVSDLLPEAEMHQYRHSGAIAACFGLVAMLVLTELT
ncbi:MAG TPA: ZIP family metal transporter, partial [Devosia sp.]|nr:ZIP family metal transporter [Devosia sp.]